MNEKTPGPGHNSVALAQQIKAFAERLIRLEDEKKAFAEDIAELKREAKGADIDPRDVVTVAKLIRTGRPEALYQREKFDGYLQTLGWLD